MIICFDIGGSTIKTAHAHSPDDLRMIGKEPTPGHDYDAFIAVLRQAIAETAGRATRVSISIAGVIDADTGVARVANIPCIDGRVLHRDLKAALGLPVDLANDADCFALAEAVQGAGRGHQVVSGIILGTGIGGGLVVRGQLINAGGGFAGEWGHGPVAQRILGDPSVTLPAFPCGCGLAGCLDAVCGARGMERLHAYLHPDAGAVDSHAIIEGWQADAPRETRTIDIWLELLAGPLAMAQNLVSAGIIPVGGGLSNALPLVEALDGAVRKRVLARITRSLIVPAKCQVEPGLIGASILGHRQPNLSAVRNA